MKLINDGARSRVKQALAAAAAALLLAACGGGGRVSDFAPTRVIAFGDESSVLDDSAEPGNARKYSINPVFSATVDCHTHRNWVQHVAEAYGLYFPECSVGLEPGTPMPSLMLAQPDADVAAVTAQIDGFLAGNSLGETDLVTVYVGVHDILSQFEAVKAGGTREAAMTAVGAAGTALVQQVKRLTDAGGKVVLVMVPGLEHTPLAVTEEAAQSGRRDLLGALTLRFNDELALAIANVGLMDGRTLGVIQFDDRVSVISRDGAGYDTPTNRSACDETHRGVNLLTCTTDTLVPQAVNRSERWLWADDVRLSAQGQWELGEQALVRARENPF